MGASLQSYPAALALNRTLASSKMQFFISTSCGCVSSWQSGLTSNRRSQNAGLHPNLSNHSASDGVDYELADESPNSMMIHKASILKWRHSPMHEPQLMTQCKLSLLRMMTGTALLCSLQSNHGNLVVLLRIPTSAQQNARISSNPDSLYLMPTTKCWSALSTHRAHGRNGRTWMQTGGDFYLYCRKHYIVLVWEPHWNGRMYPRTSPIKGPSLGCAGQTNGFQSRTYIYWDVDRRLVVEYTGKCPCIGRDCFQREHVRDNMWERAYQRELARENMSERTCQREHVRENESERVWVRLSCEIACQSACPTAC